MAGPLPKFRRFTERARCVTVLALEEAQRRRHPYLGTEHLLLGLLQDGDGIAIAVLQKAGLSIDQIRLAVERRLPRHSDASGAGEIPFTPNGKKVLQYGVEECQRLGHDHIGTEHLLLGLLQVKEGLAANVLNSLGVSLAKTRETILDLLSGAESQSDSSRTSE
jgi:ATP-dependent Clp protease ATP-binding subunit ClpC